MKLLGFSFSLLDDTVTSLSSSELLLICMRMRAETGPKSLRVVS